MTAKKSDETRPEGPHPGAPYTDPEHADTPVEPVGPHPGAPTVDSTLTAQVRQFDDQSILRSLAAPSDAALDAEKVATETLAVAARGGDTKKKK